MDVIADTGDRLTPFEVKYRATDTGAGELKGLAEFYADRKVSRAYVITKDIRDFGVLPFSAAADGALALKLPAALACYWLGKSELTEPLEG